MHCTRETSNSFWINYGKRFASSGLPIEKATVGLKPESAAAITALITEGFEAKTKQIARKAARALASEGK